MFKRFWFEFEIDSAFGFPPGIGVGCGVTAIDYNDALRIMNERVFINVKMPSIKKIVEDIDIRELDSGVVLPNMTSPNSRGVWFPIGYSE